MLSRTAEAASGAPTRSQSARAAPDRTPAALDGDRLADDRLAEPTRRRARCAEAGRAKRHATQAASNRDTHGRSHQKTYLTRTSSA